MTKLECDKCGGFYGLQDSESIDDYGGCECGGNYKEIYGYIEGYTQRSRRKSKLSLEKEGIHLIGPKSLFINLKDIAVINLEPIGKERGLIKIIMENTGSSTELKVANKVDGKKFVDSVKNRINFGEVTSDIVSDKIEIYVGEINRPYKIISKVSARADSSLLSKTATMDDVNARLREEAIKLGANAIINAKYERSSLTSWRGIKADGIAVIIESDEKKCPFCAELIKKEAIKCKHCGSMLN